MINQARLERMKLIVLDLEMNQPSRKIIQVGAVSVDIHKLDIIPFFSETVNPGELPNSYISKLTGITPEDVKAGKPLEKALSDFWSKLDLLDAPIRIAAWGDDCQKLYKDSVKLGVDVPTVQMFDLRKLCDFHRIAEAGDIRKGNGLMKMLKNYDLPFEGHHHNAYDDAYMTGKLFLAMLDQLRPMLVG